LLKYGRVCIRDGRVCVRERRVRVRDVGCVAALPGERTNAR